MKMTIITYKLSVPSKTFVVGEYLVLHAGPALILTTSPRFELIAEKHEGKNIALVGINYSSPSYKLIHRYADFYQDYSLHFIDPYRSLGGFGASSAQFVMLSAFKNLLEGKEIDKQHLLNEYKELAWNGKGFAPSGVDLISQLCGGLCYYDKSNNELQRYDWPFNDIGFCLIHTGNKVATHLHLSQLEKINIDGWQDLIVNARRGIENKDTQLFIDSIKKYTELLDKNNLIADHTRVILAELANNPDILVAKGCGALGADVILVLYKSDKKNQLTAWVKKNKFYLITLGQHVENGLMFEKLEG